MCPDPVTSGSFCAFLSIWLTASGSDLAHRQSRDAPQGEAKKTMCLGGVSLTALFIACIFCVLAVCQAVSQHFTPVVSAASGGTQRVSLMSTAQNLNAAPKAKCIPPLCVSALIYSSVNLRSTVKQWCTSLLEFVSSQASLVHACRNS